MEETKKNSLTSQVHKIKGPAIIGNLMYNGLWIMIFEWYDLSNVAIL